MSYWCAKCRQWVTATGGPMEFKNGKLCHMVQRAELEGEYPAHAMSVDAVYRVITEWHVLTRPKGGDHA